MNRSLPSDSPRAVGVSTPAGVGSQGPVRIDIHQESSHCIRDSRKAVTLGVWERDSECEQIQCVLLEEPERRRSPKGLPRATEC